MDNKYSTSVQLWLNFNSWYIPSGGIFSNLPILHCKTAKLQNCKTAISPCRLEFIHIEQDAPHHDFLVAQLESKHSYVGSHT